MQFFWVIVWPGFFRYDVAPPALTPVMEPLPKERTMLKEQQRRARILEKEQRYESEKHYHKRKSSLPAIIRTIRLTFI